MGCGAGAADAQDGPASNEAWIDGLDWPGASGFGLAVRHLWHLNTSDDHTGSLVDPDVALPSVDGLNGPVVGYWREFGTLSQVIDFYCNSHKPLGEWPKASLHPIGSCVHSMCMLSVTLP